MKNKPLLLKSLAAGIACCLLFSCNKESLTIDDTASISSLSVQSYAVGANALAPAPPVVIDYDGNHYNSLFIGTQTWMRRNLEVTHYNNGDTISNVTDNAAWINLSTGAYCSYNNVPNYKNYGLLYNGYAVADNRKLCPTGWRVPTNEDWVTLANYLGGAEIAGGKLKSTGTVEGGDGLWYAPNYGATNSTTFRGLPTGYRFKSDGKFYDDGLNGFFWTSTTQQNLAWSIGLNNTWAGIFFQPYFPEYFISDVKTGMSVRCIKESINLR
jgi:uncharacterized protein (TIGR02145 family)